LTGLRAGRFLAKSDPQTKSAKTKPRFDEIFSENSRDSFLTSREAVIIPART
jgi:hypothetical protein